KQMDMRFGTWDVRSIYRAVVEEISKYRLDLVGVQEVRWHGGCTESASEYRFFYGKGNENHELGTGFLVHKRIISEVKRVEIISDRMSYIILKGRWWRHQRCDIIVPNIHAPTEDKIDDIKDRFYKELKRAFDKFPKHHMKILLNFNAKVGREDILKPPIANESNFVPPPFVICVMFLFGSFH
ncbi:hypothetical protein B7P43_G06381, partial [Cryptotermes secundus]